MRNILTFVLILSSLSIFAQTSTLQGHLINEAGEPLLFATAVLLVPADSTMAYYAVSDENGQFFIKNIKKENI